MVFYITGHGFGHASRTIEVINALLTLEPAPTFRAHDGSALAVRSTVTGPFTDEHVRVDTGIVQIDSLRLDEAASVRAPCDSWRLVRRSGGA